MSYLMIVLQEKIVSGKTVYLCGQNRMFSYMLHVKFYKFS